MKTAINVLIIEDSKVSAELMVRELESKNYSVTYDITSNESAFLEKLGQKDYDVILADYHLPQWDAEIAFAALKKTGKNIPFIVVTGTLGEERAIDLIKKGIQDLVLKGNLIRLPIAVDFALRKKELEEREKRALQDLALSELRFRGVLEQAEIAIYGYDADGTILFWNHKCEDIFGIDSETALGKNIFDFIRSENPEIFRERMGKIFSEENVPAEDWMKTDFEGKKRFFHSSYYGVKENSGKVLLGVSVTLDITDRVTLEQQLVQAQKMEAVGQLAGGIAHDFNNQLTVVLGNLKLALKQIEEKNPIFSLLVDAEKAADSCAYTIKGLLTFGRKSEEAQRITLDFHGVLSEFEKLISHLLPDNVTVHVDKKAERCLIDADSTQIQQVLMNLAVNARDAMPQGGSLYFETQNVYFDENYAKKIPGVLPGQFLCIAVTDTGTGIPPEIIPRIFEPFFTTKKPGEGTGLGLSSVYGIVKSFGGWVSVYSEGGRGTTFKIYIPTSLREAKPDQKTEYAKVRGGTETILVADDEDAIRHLAKIVLEQKGYHVLEAKDGAEAHEVCKNLGWLVDLILLDLSMPKLTIEETLKLIFSAHPHVKVLVSSGYSLAGEMAKSLLNQGAVAFVQKPYHPDELARVIRAVLDLRISPESLKKAA